MLISDFDYILPQEKIASFGPEIRGQSRLVVLDRQTASIQDNFYYNLDQYLNPGDLVVLNNTKVIPARIKGRIIKDNYSGQDPEIEILLTEYHPDTDHDRQKHIWSAVYRGNVRPGQILGFYEAKAEVVNLMPGGLAMLHFDQDPLDLCQKIGEIPIPPYLKREETEFDRTRYNTEFASNPGSVAAPTASLNFTKDLQEKLQSKGVKIKYITLHVGLGTFMPIRTSTIEDHKMHAEYFEIPAETVKEIHNTKKYGNKVISIGTTVTRTLEYAAPMIEAFDPKKQGMSITGEADIFIYPGYEFNMVDAVLTNFHAPRSTPLMMISAFTGYAFLMEAYQHALKNDYQFLSYGDSMLII